MERVTVDTADSLDLIASMEYDAIVTDARCRGQTVSRCWVRSGRSGLARPPLVITGHGDHALAIDALRGGAYDFIQKPIDREYFVTSGQGAESGAGRHANEQQGSGPLGRTNHRRLCLPRERGKGGPVPPGCLLPSERIRDHLASSQGARRHARLGERFSGGSQHEFR